MKAKEKSLSAAEPDHKQLEPEAEVEVAGVGDAVWLELLQRGARPSSDGTAHPAMYHQSISFHHRPSLSTTLRFVKLLTISKAALLSLFFDVFRC
jgi:hypothetical protein